MDLYYVHSGQKTLQMNMSHGRTQRTQNTPRPQECAGEGGTSITKKFSSGSLA